MTEYLSSIVTGAREVRITFEYKRAEDQSGMQPSRIADTLAAYLLGAEVYRTVPDPSDLRPHGPYKKTGEEFRWQLDHSNDYFLRYDPATHQAVFTARYDSERTKKLMLAIAELFIIQYDMLYRIED